ncbi:MAG: heavy-metal-associated domain-containing protein [Wenzhouxiangella sp.]|nr:MAG: heavy-metal-associated domain-containing protein [Wenzhouxiangella sp.]
MNNILKTALISFLLVALAGPVGATSDENTLNSVRVEVNGLVCAFCARGIRNTFNRESATADVLVSLENRLVAVEFKPGMQLSDEEITKRLTDSGYNVVSITRTDESVASIRASLK